MYNHQMIYIYCHFINKRRKAEAAWSEATSISRKHQKGGFCLFGVFDL
jgi:hypothetical protein